MKYYIPTTTLNFNCILSTESISPVAFYSARGFGYSRWYTVPENGEEGVVLLYDKPFFFSRPKSDLEDHPLLIEVDTDEAFISLKDGIFASKWTIYLDPFRARFIFFSDEAKKTALSLSESSLETKMVPVYDRKRMDVIETFEGTAPSLSGIKFPQVDMTWVEYDKRINKMKGLLYGYYIGAMLSASSEDVRCLNGLREMRDVASAILASSDHRPLERQRETIETRLAEMMRRKPLFLALEKCVGEKAFEVLKVLETYDQFPFPHEYQIDYLLAHLKEGQRWIDGKIDEQEQKMRRSQSRISPDEKPEILVESEKERTPSVTVIDRIQTPMERNLFLAWVNETIRQDRFNGKVISNQKALADALTYKAKDVLGTEWVEGNDTKTYLNDLRRHIAGETFTQPWNDGLLSSLAAVVLKGDDWQKLLRFMQSQEMTDYRLAFAFYGELNGFANLGRDFTDYLVDVSSSESRKYLGEVYKAFYGQLHDIQLKEPSSPTREVPETTSSSDPSVELSVGNGTIPFGPMVMTIFDSSEFRSKVSKSARPEDLKKGLEHALEDCACSQQPETLLNALARYSGWGKKTKAWKSLKDAIQKLNQMEIEFVPDRSSIPDRSSKYLFVDDPMVCKALCAFAKTELNFNDKKTELLKENISYFQKGYQPKGKFSKDPERNPRNNEKTILHFRNQISKQTRANGEDNPYRVAPRESDVVEKIRNFLEKRYGCIAKTDAIISCE